MDKIKASVVVIGFQKEDHKMYPHLHDFLQNMRDIYADVIYIGDDDRGMGLYYIDLLIKNIPSVVNFKRLLYKVHAKLFSYFTQGKILIKRNKHANLKYHETFSAEIKNLAFPSEGRSFVNKLKRFIPYVISNVIPYAIKRRRLIKRIKCVKLKYDKSFIVAIDHTATYFAEKYFPGKVIFWSIDILAKDAPWRIKNGFLEKLITSEYALKSKVLMIQDENRKKLLEESFGVSFPNTIYLPVSLNDLEFCRKQAKTRQKRSSFSTVNIVQNGWIADIRWSDQLIDAYQNWSPLYKLYLHGFIGNGIKDKIRNAKRKPTVSIRIYDSDGLPHILNNYDIGFVGYKEDDANHHFIENASSQLVMFLRLGIPVIGCGSSLFNDFLTKKNIGIGISSIEEIEEAIKKIIGNYSFFSCKARNLYELRFNLNSIFDNYLIKAFETMCLVKSR